MMIKSFKAEYLLKSAINAARVLLQNDKTPEDSPKDIWGPFIQGMELPAEIFEIPEYNVRLSLEIRPEESKIPLSALVSTPSRINTPDKLWRDVLLRLFINLGFAQDQEQDQTPLFKGRIFTPEEMVANLIDFIDEDSTPYIDGNFRSIESEQTSDFFLNRKITRIGELSGVPGFTQARIRKMSPFLTTAVRMGQVNINVAPRIVLKSLHEDMTDEMVERMIQQRAGDAGPIKTLSDLIGFPQLQGITTGGRFFQVVAKVDYGVAAFFARSIIERPANGNEPPRQISLELF